MDYDAMPEFDAHAMMIPIYDEASGLEAYVSIHRKNGITPSFGATRLWRYETSLDAVRDALRLSRVMSYKAALAGLPCGGAKAVIRLPLSPFSREEIIERYADALRSISAEFITGTDVGIMQDDLTVMKKRTPNIVGFNNNSTRFTVLGVSHAIRCTLREAMQDDAIAGKRFAIQGLGKIGGGLLEEIYSEAKTIYVADVKSERVQEVIAAYPKVIPVDPSEIHRQSIEVFAPCALGSVLNRQTVPELRCAAIVGGANDQLENDEVGDMLHENGILYAPDYVVNAGGLIAVYDEYEHADYDEERVMEKVMMIEDRLGEILSESAIENSSPHRIANAMAERVFNGYKPEHV